jgi:hypothetical protein
VHLIVPVFIYGHNDSGVPFREITRTLTIEATGGLVELAAPVSKKHPILLVNIATGHSISCRVASIRKGSNGKAEVGIYFALPSPGFWGLEFPPDGPHPTILKES